MICSLKSNKFKHLFCRFRFLQRSSTPKMNSIFLLSDEQIEEVHFNLWVAGSDSFLDVGLKLNKGQKVELYLPWQNAQPEDLFNTIKEKEVLSALFNEHLSIVVDTKNPTYVTADLGGGRKIGVVECKFELESEKKETKNNIFTKIHISSEYTNEEQQSYLRFRFKGNGPNVFSKRHTGMDAFISPYHESIEVIDFRINEVRTVPWNVFKTKIKKTPPIKKIHFFLLKSYQENNTLASPSYLRCRELEDKAWDKYLPERKPNDATLAYHWKKEELEGGNHYSILATFTKKKTSKRTVFGYVLVIVFLGYLSCYLYEILRPNWALPNVPIENACFFYDKFKPTWELPKVPTENSNINNIN